MEITSFYQTEFSTNWETVAQQMGSRFRSCVASGGDLKGKRKWFNMLNARSMTQVTTRKGDTPDGDSSGDKYWLYGHKYEDVIVFDEDDERQLGDIVLPNSDEVNGQAEAYNRTVDDEIIAAFDATRYIGEDGTTTDAFPSSQSVAVDYVASGAAANSGLTMAKIRRAAKLLNVAEIPKSERYFAYTAQQLDNLLATTEATSRDYSEMQALKDGKITYFMGFNWIDSERLPIVTATDVRSCFAWHKSAIKMAEGPKKVHMDILPTRRHASQIRTVARVGAVRTENVKVVRVYCDESP